jgi:hypothetical protein
VGPRKGPHMSSFHTSDPSKLGIPLPHVSEGRMKSLNEFLQHVLDDLGTWCDTSTSQDLKTILARIEHEGLSFLTITLPAFGKDFERSLDEGQVVPRLLTYSGKKRSLPRLLSGFFELVFDRSTGRLLDDPSIVAIWAIRQFTLMFAKIALPCTPARERAAMAQYVETERQVHDNLAEVDPGIQDSYLRVGRLLWASVFSRVDRLVHDGEINPKHGPGATADSIRGNAKWDQQEWTDRLEQVFPFGEYLAANWRYFQDLGHVRHLEPGAERPVRVISVPKTLTTPRIIAIEPVCMQYMQQGLLDVLQRELQADRLAWGFIGWTSEMPNQHLAREGSRNGAYATLDLREASDRVANQHVRGLLRNHSWLASAVDSCRSRTADVLGHGIIPLAKFASMGSALTFPFEAMVFTTLIFTGIEKDLGRPLTLKDITSYQGKVRCYGDDIIVPVEHVSSVISSLEAFGLLVNTGKSFWTGKFRESCGGDFYDGEDVRVTRLRTELPTSRHDVQEIVSTISTRNQLYRAGMWKTVAYLDELLGGLIPFPYVHETSPVLGRHSFLGIEIPQKECSDLHRPLVRGMRVKSVIPVSKLEGAPALLKCLSMLERRETSALEEVFLPRDAGLQAGNEEHLERLGRPVSVIIKSGWGPVA